MNIRQMEIFRAVMRAGSVTAAAQALNVSQPAVSAMLRHCEDQIGTKLFLRVGRRLRPTPEAAALFPEIDRLFRQIETETRIAREVLSGTRGAVSIAATHAAAPAVAQAISSFIGRRSVDLRISLQSLPSVEVVDRVLSREVDFGIAYGPILEGAIEAELFAMRRVVCAMAPDHPLAARRSLEMAELVAQRVITYGAHTALGRTIHAALGRHGGRAERQIEVNSTRLALILAESGAGVALVDLAADVTQAALLAVRPLTPRIQVRLFLVFARGRQRSRLTQDFVHHLQKRSAPEVPGR
jgi:DNA-binding transcriptional LysR family regulator